MIPGSSLYLILWKKHMTCLILISEPMAEKPSVCQKLDEVCPKYPHVERASKMFAFVLKIFNKAP